MEADINTVNNNVKSSRIVSSAILETIHNSLIHDAQPNWRNTIMATCSSDCTVHLYNIENNTLQSGNQPFEILTGHTGPVYKIAWAHPKFEDGKMFATCSYDKKVILWHEYLGKWQVLREFEPHSDSILYIEWCNFELGLILACASVDGTISLLFKHEDEWHISKVENAHQFGVTCLSWGPIFMDAFVEFENEGVVHKNIMKQLVSCGMDKTIKVWKIDEYNKFECVFRGEAHHTSMMAVAWAPDLGFDPGFIVSGDQSGKVMLWRNERGGGAGGGGGSESGSNTDQTVKCEEHSWYVSLLADYKEPVWSISFSYTGTNMSVCSGDSRLSMWRIGLNGKWQQLAQVSDPQELAVAKNHHNSATNNNTNNKNFFN